jgi:hypothetical protein
MTSTRNQLTPMPSTEEYRPDLLGSVTVIAGNSFAIDKAGWQGQLCREETPNEREVEITALPD